MATETAILTIDELLAPFTAATVKVLETFAQTVPTAGVPVVRKDAVTYGVVTGVIGMASEQLSGNLIVSFERATILGIVSKMFGEPFSEVNSEVADAVGEITNMICGMAKKDFGDRGISFNFATPMVVQGSNMELRLISNSQVCSVPFSTSDGLFVVETNLSKPS
jgi:chemotaxis protein CheX